MAALVRLPPGALFARDFRVVRPLAEGGMGAVYVVEQVSTGVPRALKIMHPQLVADDRARERFVQEARIGAQIPSDHVVAVVAAGVDDETGTPWLAMELLEGEDLQALVTRRGRLAPDETLDVFEQLGHALGRAHAAGVVHRDLKPENLFLAVSRRRGERFVVKVLDFGIARLVREGQAGGTVTAAIGSPLWMAPEQAQQGARVRPATDVWALGLIAFYLLTGRSYWTGGNVPPEAFNLSALLVEVMVQPLDPASVRARALGVEAHLPPGFDAWFARCAARDPDARFQDADAAVAALAQVLRQGSAAPRPVAPSPTVASLPPPAPAWLPTAQGTVASLPPPVPSGTMAVPGGAAVGARATAPVASSPRRAVWWVGVAGVAVALGGVGVFARSRSTPEVDGTHTNDPARGAQEAREAPVGPMPAPSAPGDLRCPEGTALVSGGTFVMGSAEGRGGRDERPARAVTVSAFCLDRTEVTVARYNACVMAGRCTAAGGEGDWPGISEIVRARTRSQCNARQPDRAEHPVNCVDQAQAAGYCRALGRRLPTEAEWEYAARGAAGRTYPWGEAPPTPARLNGCGREGVDEDLTARPSARALYEDDGWPTTAPVGSFPEGASPEGVLDLAGNVWEWTADWYGAYPAPSAAPERDPTGPASGTRRVERGGGWNSRDADGVRGAYRDWDVPAARRPFVGFRCALPAR